MEESSREERDPNMEVNKDITILGDSKNHWKDVVEDNIDPWPDMGGPHER